MKKYFICFALAASVSAFGQGHGRASAGAMGGRPAGAGATMGAPGNAGSGATGANSHAGQKTPDQLLTQNTKLASKLDSLLPSGTTAQQACSGFKNLGQCVAAIHVSNNLGIPFDQLKAKMTGTSPESLGSAIHDLKPDANAKSEQSKAKKQAKSDLANSSS